MRHGVSTHVFLTQPLTPALLDALASTGAGHIEIVAARHHFDYTSREQVRELARWFRSQEVTASLHMPLFSAEDGANWSRHTAPSLNLIHAVKAERIAAMDEVKRAMEAAEMIPMNAAVIHLGQGEDKWGTRALDDSLTALEHLKAFAGPLGMRLLLENLGNDVATPERLFEIVRVGHLDSVGFCLDLGHAHIASEDGIANAFAVFGDRIGQLHVHDNHGMRDEHLWPGDGTIDFAAVSKLASGLKQPPVGVLEIAYDLGLETSTVVERVKAAFERL